MDTIVVFDFDCTITKRDSFRDFLIHTFGINSFCRGILANIHFLLPYSLKIVSNHKAKEELFSYYFAMMSETDYVSRCLEYSISRIDDIINENAICKIKWHKSNNHKLVLASASMTDWIRPWAIKNGFHDVIATEKEVKNGMLTGKFAGKNCFGQEKKRRFLEKYPDRAQYKLYVYGDSNGDIQLLDIADEPYYRRF